MLRKTHLQLEALEARYLLNGRTDFLVNTTLTGNQLNPAVAADGQGNFVVVWEGLNPSNGTTDIFAQRYRADGTALGGEILVNTLTAGTQNFAKVATDLAGDFVVVWRGPNPNNGKNDIWGRRFDAAGQAVSPADVLLNPASEGLDSGAQVALTAGGNQVVVTRTSTLLGDQDIFAQRYDSTLQSLSAAFLVNTARAGPQTTSRLAMDAAGNFVVTWNTLPQALLTIAARRFDSQGQPLTAEFTIGATVGNRTNSALALAPDGGFLTVWVSANPSTNNLAVTAQRYTAFNQPGAAFLVSDPAIASPFAAAGFDGNGGFVIAWQTRSTDVPPRDNLFAQRYDSAATLDGPVQQLNIGPASDQSPVVLAVASNGAYLSAWAVAVTANDLDVHAALVTPANQPPVLTSLSGTTSGLEGDLFAFHAAASDPNGDSLTYSWDLDGDGSFDDASGPDVQFGTTAVGSHSIAVLVTDTQGESVFGSITYTVVNVPPTADPGPSQTIFQAATAFVHGSASDPGSDDETYFFEWDFQYDGQTFQGDAAGPDTLNTYLQPGTYQVALRISDSNGGTGIGLTTVTVLNVAPTVDAGSDQAVDEGTTATFHGTHSDPGLAVETYVYEWDFDYDGQTFDVQASGADASFQFLAVGTFQAALRVTDNNGGSSIDLLSVTVNNVAPSANAGPDQTVDEASTATFHGSASDPGADLETFVYEWDFHYDGQTFLAQATGADVSYQFQEPGVYPVALRVTDSNGGSSIDVLIVTVQNVAPTASAGLEQTIEEGATAAFHGSATDPGAVWETFLYEWDFNYDGQNFVVQATGEDVTRTFAQPGTYQVALRVTDSYGGSGISLTTVTVTNVAPTADAGPDQTLSEGGTAAFHGVAQDPGDPAEPLVYEWDFRYDGQTFQAQASGADTTHTFVQPGTFQVALRVTDSYGASGLDVVTVTVTDLPPTVSAGSDQTINEGSTAAFHGYAGKPSSTSVTYVYEWDFDYDGQTFDSEVSGVDVTRTFLDPGVFQVALRVTDSYGGSAIDVVTVTVNNVAPTSFAGPPQTTPVGGTASFHGQASDPGRTDEVLTSEWDFAYDGQLFHSQGLGCNVAHQFLVPGVHQVAFRVTDAYAASTLSVTTVTVQADLPDLVLSSITTPEGNSRVFLTYEIQALAPLTTAVQVSLYASTRSDVVAASARWLGTATIKPRDRDLAGNAALAPGIHIVVRSTSDLGFLTDRAWSSWTGQDYYLLAWLDSAQRFTETDEDNNDAVYAGVYRVVGTNRIFIQGTDEADTVQIESHPGRVTVTWNGAAYEYSTGAAKRVDVRLHGGNDILHAGTFLRSLWAWGGAGDDLLEGGAGHDLLFGGADNDTLIGHAGADLLFGGSGDDWLWGQHGSDWLFGDADDDHLAGGLGLDWIVGGGGSDLVWQHGEWQPLDPWGWAIG